MHRDEAAEVLPGQAVPRDAVSVRQVESWRDELRSLAPPPGETVAEDLRPLLDAYYRAVAEAASRPARR